LFGTNISETFTGSAPGACHLVKYLLAAHLAADLTPLHLTAVLNLNATSFTAEPEYIYTDLTTAVEP